MRVPLVLSLLALPFLQVGEAIAQEGPPEQIEIGLSTDSVAITPNFAGTNLTIFGALDNADPMISRQGNYDVIVVLEGPSQALVVRRKTRVLGMWINTQSEVFLKVPSSYSEAMTRQPQDITSPTTYERLSLGPDYMRLAPLDKDAPPEVIEQFRDALIKKKRAAGLYSERPGSVQFLSQSLFRATLSLAPNVPVGTHLARAYLFRSGQFLRATSAPLTIRKSGAEQRIFEAAHEKSLIYGLSAVLLAALTGWMGRLVFRKD
jgi:uncharacterized protein (TIGR02186 family)